MVSTSATGSAVQRKMFRKGVVRVGKGITLVISNEDMDDIIKIIKSLENSGVLIDVVNETVKDEIKKQEGGYFGMLLQNLGASLLGNMVTGKDVLRAGKGVVRAGIVYNNVDNVDKNF